MATAFKIADVSTVDWSQWDSIMTTFPFYAQERFRLEKVTKNLSKKIDIELFTLQTPHKDQTLLKDTSLTLEPGKRMCLYGGNGTGKTLLFERMADAGIKGFPTHLNVHHMKEMDHQGDKAESVLDTVVHSHIMLQTLLKCKAAIDAAIATEKDEEKLAATKLNSNMIEAQLRTVGAETAVDRASKMLRAVGFDEEGQNKSTNDLSGGLRMRVALCIAFFSEPDVLLLDEPTNHLDFPSVLWLENRLRAYKGSFLMVTHDRDLLNNTTTGVMLIQSGKIKTYDCGFKDFEVRKGKEDKKQSEENERFLKLNRNADPSTMLGRQVSDKTKWTQEYYERTVRMAGKFTFPPPTPLAAPPGVEQSEISLLHLKCTFSYAPNAENPYYIFPDEIEFNVKQGSRFGIMGPNGAGKSTLLKLLTGKLTPTTGSLYTNPDFLLAYFGQHSTAELDMSKTPMEFMMEQFPDSSSGALRNHLSKTGVSGGKESTRMEGLSYSQRSCVIFSKLTFVCPHLLIMDEPTNFLDIDSVDSLISAANKFQGALLVVTHSRHFLRKCAKNFLSIVPGQFLTFDNMDEAERATYTFIQELESGVKIDASVLSVGGGSRLVKKVAPDGQVIEEVEEIVIEFELGEHKFNVGDKVLGIWSDKKYYPAEVKKVVGSAKGPKYSLFYEKFNKTAGIIEAGVKPMPVVVSPKEKAAIAKAATAAAVAKSAHVEWKVGDKALAQHSNGQWYEATIERVMAFDTFIVTWPAWLPPVTGAVPRLGKNKLRIFNSADATKEKAPRPVAGERTGPSGGRGGRGGAKGGRPDGRIPSRRPQGQRKASAEAA